MRSLPGLRRCSCSRTVARKSSSMSQMRHGWGPIQTISTGDSILESFSILDIDGLQYYYYHYLLLLTVFLNFNVSYYHVISYTIYESSRFPTTVRNTKHWLTYIHLLPTTELLLDICSLLLVSW